MTVGSIEEEAALCRAAFAGSNVGDRVQHCHHARWIETLTEPAENRILCILSEKNRDEQAVRLHLFRPLPAGIVETFNADRQKAYADWQKAQADWQKAEADWQKAEADWQKAEADWQKAEADWQKAYADWQKAEADWQKAEADWQKAYADPAMLAIHAAICGCPWSATTDIFGARR